MRKTKNEHGFTLIEMLVVVAIIAILIAISIPMVSNVLENSRVATDEANERSAKAAALMAYMTYDPNDVDSTVSADIYKALTTSQGVVYDAANGILQSTNTTISVYGKCQRTDHPSILGTSSKCGGHGAHGSTPAEVLYVRIPTSGTINVGEVLGAWGPVKTNTMPKVSSEASRCHILRNNT